jgi:hypothetical protein
MTLLCVVTVDRLIHLLGGCTTELTSWAPAVRRALWIIWGSRIVWMGEAVRIRISTTEQIKASAGADAARAAPGGTVAAAGSDSPHQSFSVVTHVWAVRKDRPQVTHRGIETDGGIAA